MSDRAEYRWRLAPASEKSGLSEAEFCRRRQVNVGSFAEWKRRLKRAAELAIVLVLSLVLAGGLSIAIVLATPHFLHLV